VSVPAGCLVAGEPLDEELAKCGAPRPVVATRKRRPRERERSGGREEWRGERETESETPLMQ